mmetsp:Transcript_16396/g.27712  ORF Transcript_16396/g.27712 Transcript_16396/m.27712 type:complete len:297 (+) Transcript_16396:141-1031(+)
MSLGLIMFLLISLSKFSLSRTSATALQMSTPKVSTLKHAKGIAYHIRTAKREDIVRIDRCNRANLPENYGLMFYKDHLERWPELSLIALSESDEMMGYALGRIEMLPIDRGSNLLYSKTEYVGHVASIAVNEQFRGCGVAKNLMLQLQSGLAQHYDIDDVTLYCRISNAGAIKLYSDSLNYMHQKTVPGYYADGEDACLMKMTGLLDWQQLRLQQRSRQDDVQGEEDEETSLEQRQQQQQLTGMAQENEDEDDDEQQEQELRKFRQNRQQTSAASVAVAAAAVAAGVESPGDELYL